ncbi:MAG TPA: hypothetical protein ENJ80_13105 [Gammaproteobacteria bacterium]|nr:hypothetical protein [Gammaproteobacteria bacterium]
MNKHFKPVITLILGSILITGNAFAASVSLSGMLTIEPGFRKTINEKGSWFAMNSPSPNGSAVAMLKPGTAGGIILGEYQNFVLDPDEPHLQGWKGDTNGDGIPDGAAGTGYGNPPVKEGTALAPFKFFGVNTYVGLNPLTYQAGGSRPAPNVMLDLAACSGSSCAITAEFSAWEVMWNGSAFEQGPRPDKDGPFGLATGTLDINTLAYSLDWSSQIKNGPFNGVPAFWHIEGTYIPVSAVPIPAAAWLFCSGLAGLLTVCRRRIGKTDSI